ncbi:hypothetical protein [Nonomuraea typhae]|uniref:Abortive infection protein-like C-terminal domain-containing protein n=1 Tax=Nonomuraea typhae TaxID=2603600 RepID=A0ABW7ZCF9_9ACTN
MTETTNPWRPLNERLDGMTGERALVEGTPDYLLEPLQTWLYEIFISRQHGDFLTRLQLKLRRQNLAQLAGGQVVILLKDQELLAAIDGALHMNCDLLEAGVDPVKKRWWKEMLVRLLKILNEGGSAWTITDNVDGLTARVNPTVAQAARTTVKDAKASAADHLRKAWDAAYGFQPDPTLAYSEAVKAVEDVVIPETIPRDNMPTLGKALTHLTSTRGKWTLAIDDKNGQPATADALISLLELLWHGQRDRHAGPTMKPASQETAQMAVHTAAVVVQWFSSGNVRKKP